MSKRVKLDIAMVVPGLPFDGDTLEKHALGGSETAAIYMAKGMARAGAQVIVFCNTEGASQDKEGVRYLPIQVWPHYGKSTQHDVTIIQRAPELMASQSQASRLNVLWMHDLAIMRQAATFKSMAWNVDFAFVLSDFMKEQYKKVFGVEDSMFHLTRNGIDLSLFKGLQKTKRDRFHLVYAARPERGLDVLLERVMPALLARDSRYRLTVCGYENTVPQWELFYAKNRRSAAALGTGVVTWAGALTKRELYALYAGAGVYVYPTPSPALPNFAEVSCISAMECQAAGLPIVTSNKGALVETIAIGAGALIEGEPTSDEYIKKFCDAVHRYATEDEAFELATVTGTAAAQNLDWQSEAERWLELFEYEIRLRNNDNDRMLREMWRMSDIVAARKWLHDRPAEFNDWVRLRQLLQPFDFMDEKDGYRKQYERIGATHDTWVYDTAPNEPRFGLLRQWLNDNRDSIKTVLDYGCAHGAYAIGLAQQLPRLQIHGVDIDHFSTDMATEWAAKRGVEKRATFEVWTHDAPYDSRSELFDAALLQEVLEHVPEPWAVIQNVERRVKKGGKVYITVPFGPWEYSSYHNYPWRCHIWHFDKHDLLDMVGKKQNIVIDSYLAGASPELDNPMGWWIVQYDADHEPIGEIDMERKRWLARPRHTVSGCIIAGGNAAIETFLWALRPLYHLCDEIIIADCGMPNGELEKALDILDKAEPIARWHEKVVVVQGVNPLKDGFERARNKALDACSMDFVLWIDLDEKLLNPSALQKYLRDNIYQGYGLRQHHLAVDFALNPDMPVRLFRRRPYEGKELRFIGAIHEHPELAVNEGPGPVVVLSDAHIAHVGYLTESIRQNRFARNFPLLQLDQERYPDRLLQKFFLMRDKVQIARFELSQNGGVVTDQIKALMREVVELGRKHFIGKGSYMNSDAIAYYSQALEILGEGFSTTFSIEADRAETRPNGSATYRFANKEDFMAEFTRRANEKIDPLTAEYY